MMKLLCLKQTRILLVNVVILLGIFLHVQNAWAQG
jgi:hypothetical protein